MNSESAKKSNFLGDTVESKYTFLDLGKQFDYNKEKEKNVRPASTKVADIRKDNVKQYQMYSGGFKMMDLPNKNKKSKAQERKEQEELMKKKAEESKKFDYKNYFPKKDDIYQKLGIRSDEVEVEDDADPENNEYDQLEQELLKDKEEEENNKNHLNYIDYNYKFGINKDDFFSTDDPSIQTHFREKLIGEVEHKVDKIHSKRDLLQNRKDNLKIIEKKQKLKIHRDAEEQLTEKQKVALYKNVDDDVDELIHEKWKKKNPEVNQVENVIDRHREKMKELEQLYYKKKLNQHSTSNLVKSEPMYMEDEVLTHLVEGKVDLDLNHKKSYRTLNDKLVKMANYTHRQLQDDEEDEDGDNEQKEQFNKKKQLVGSFDGDMYDFGYLRDKKQRKDLEKQKQDEEMEIIIPKKPQRQVIQESSPKRNQGSQGYQGGGIGFLSDTSQSINLQKLERLQDIPKEKQFQERPKYTKEQTSKVEKEVQSPKKQAPKQREGDNSLEKKKQQTMLNERDRKLQILREEMSQIDKLMQEPGVGRKKVYIEPSDKAIENATHIPIEKKIYQHKYEEYLVDKKIKDSTDNYFKKMTKPDFERVKSAKSFEKYKQLHPDSEHEFTITDRPIEFKKTYEDIIKDEDEAHIQQYSEQIEKGKRSVEEKRMKNLYTRIISDSKQSINKRKQKDDDFIIKFLFMQIDTSKSGFVSAQEIFDCLKENKDAIVYFDLCVKTLYADLDKFKTQRKGLFSIEEFSNFVVKQNEMSKKTLQGERETLKQQILQEENLLHKIDKLKDKNELFLQHEKDPQNTYGTCVLNEAKLDVLREIFSELDTFSDYIVKRLDLVKEINNNERIQKILTYPAVKIPIVNRKVSLQNILEQIEKEYTLSNEQQQKSKEYISWNQFFEYFRNYQKPTFILEHEASSSEEAKVFDIKEDFLLLIQDVFDMIPRVSNTLDYVATTDFILAAKKDPQIRSIEGEIVRTKSKETGLQEETLGETLDRILAEGGEYIQWHEIKLFFSQRGRPLSDEFAHEEVKKDDVQINIQTEKLQKKPTKEGFSPKKQQSAQKIQADNDDEDNQYYDEESQNGKKYDMYENQKKVKRPNVQEEIDKLRLEGNYDSADEQNQSDDYMKEIQDDVEDDLDHPKYNQLKQLDYMRKGGVPDRKKTAEEAIQDHYSKKRVIKPSGEDQELKQEINEFDKYYKELMQRQKDAQLGPLDSLQQKEQLEDPVKYGLLKHTAVDYDKYFGNLIKHKVIHQKEKVDLTVPKPFAFDQRESTKPKTIYQQKKDQYLAEVMNRDNEEMKKRFKANPIPTTTKVPMFNNIIEKNKEKREKVRQESVKMTLETQNPFSFYEKDIQKREDKKQKILESVNSEMTSYKQKTFKANEVPASSKVDMMKQMELEKEENRKKRVEDRKQEQLKSVKEFSRLAGASEQWKETLKKRETTKTWEEEKCTFAPKVNKDIPETSKKQTTEAATASAAVKMKAVTAFTGLLSGKPPTEQKPFNFQPPVHKPTNREHMDAYNESIKADKLEHKNLLARLAPSMKKKASEQKIEEPQEIEENQEQEQPAEEQEEQTDQKEEGDGEDKLEGEEQDLKSEKKNSQVPSMTNISSKKQPSMANVDKAEKDKGGTKSGQLLMKKREEEKKKKLEEENQKIKEKEEREKKLKDRAGEVREKFGNPVSAKQAQEEMEKQKLKERQEIARQQKQEYQQQIKDMESRVKNKQLLTEAKSHGSSTLDKYRKMKPKEKSPEEQKIEENDGGEEEQKQQEEEQQQQKQNDDDDDFLKESQVQPKSNNNLDLQNISGIDTKKEEQAEENYDEDFGEENDGPVKKDDFDDLSD